MAKGLPFYRCVLCRGVISPWDIYQGNHQCPKCGGARMSPTNLTLWEKIVQIFKHPKLWAWHEDFK
jgi:hypothetical protein